MINLTGFNLIFYLDQTSLTHIFKNQISSLVIEIVANEYVAYEDYALIFPNIIIMFSNLKYLNFHPSDVCLQRITFNSVPTSVFSSTLLELRIQVFTVEDCLYLLDGRFDQLRVFNVRIRSGGHTILKIYKVDF